MCEIIQKFNILSEGSSENIKKKSTFFLNEVQKTLKKVNIIIMMVPNLVIMCTLCRMRILWHLCVSHAYLMRILCVCYDYSMRILCGCHAYPMRILSISFLWVSYAYPMRYHCVSYAFSMRPELGWVLGTSAFHAACKHWVLSDLSSTQPISHAGGFCQQRHLNPFVR